MAVVAAPDEQQSTELCTPDIPISKSPSPRPQFSARVNDERWGWGVIFCFNKITVTKTHALSDSGDVAVDEQVSYTAGLPLYRLYIRLSLNCGSLAPLSLLFEFPQVLDRRDVFAREVWETIRADDVLHLRTLLSTGRLALNAAIKYNVAEVSLFQVTYTSPF